MTSFSRSLWALALFGAALAIGSCGAFAQDTLADTSPPGGIAVYPPAATTEAAAGGVVIGGDTVPELLHYRFSGTGTTTPNLASAPPANTAVANLRGGVAQTGADLNTAGDGFSLEGTGLSSTTDFLDTGWATQLSGSWTISFASANIGPSSTLFYVFGDASANSFRCFTNGVAGPDNWILRGGGLTDVLVPGAAVVQARRTTFVYDAAASEIRAYLDGVLVNTVAQNPLELSFSGAGPFKVMGYGSNVGAPAGGLIDDFRLYNRALSAAEVASIDAPVGNLQISDGGVLPFGEQRVGITSAPRSITLSNSGTAPLSVTALSAAEAPFARTGGSCPTTLPFALAEAGSCTLEYSFTPAAVGASSQVLTVTADAPGSGSISLSGTGVQGSLSISPTALAFGNQPVGSSSAAASVTLSNSGGAPLSITALTTAAAPFARSGGSCPDSLPIALAAGASCSLEYSFLPTAAVTSNQTLTVTADAPGSGSISLSGTGVQGSLSISPTALVFGNQPVGSSSAAATVTLSNSGGAPLSITALTTAAAPFARSGGSCPDSLPIALAAGASCSLEYSFSPTAAVTSNQTLTVTADAPGSGSISLSGTGVLGSLSISPTALAFGNQPVGSTGAAATVTLSNTGGAPLSITALTTAAAPFARSGGSCADSLPIALAAGASCSLEYSFSPTAAVTSNQTLTVTADAPGSGSISLSGTGVLGMLSVSPGSLAFDDQPVGSTSAAATVTLSNTGGAPLSITALTAAAAPFARSGGSCADSLPITLAAGASCSLQYSFAPTAGGSASQSLSVDAGTAGAASIGLTGSGTVGLLQLSASTIDFGRVAVGSRSDSLVILSNTGSGPINITALTAPSAPFALSGGSCGATPIRLQAGTQCTLVYSFIPIGGQTAEQRIDITTDVGTQQLSLLGAGLVAQVAQVVPVDHPGGLAGLLVLIMAVGLLQLRRR